MLFRLRKLFGATSPVSTGNVPPADVEKLLASALALQQAGSLAAAEVTFRKALSISPAHPDTAYHLGNLLAQRGDYRQAEPLLRSATLLDKENPEYPASHGNILMAQGRFAEAAEAYRHGLALKPEAQVHFNLGSALVAMGRFSDALTSFLGAVELSPDFAAAYSNLSGVYFRLGQYDKCIEAAELALSLDSSICEAYNNKNLGLYAMGRFAEAESICRQAIALRGDYADAHSNLGNALKGQGELRKSIAAYDRALAIRPGDLEFLKNRALVYLTLGDFEHGWLEYEFRLQSNTWGELFPEKYSQPVWQGEELAGRTILLCAEQGFGDAIQFVRFASLIAERGAKVVLSIHPELQRLVSGVSGVAAAISFGQALPAYDFWCPLMSLPHMLGTRLETLPREVPYLTVPPDILQQWQIRLAGLPGLKVGLTWAGNSQNTSDALRSIGLEQFAPLLKIPGVTFVNLHKDGVPARIAGQFPAILDWMGECRDFLDTAALIENLDLVIAVDTAIAHLAGGLGKPVWLLNRVNTDWRWMLGCDDSLWYPGLRQFRQREVGNWAEPIARLCEELASASLQFALSRQFVDAQPSQPYEIRPIDNDPDSAVDEAAEALKNSGNAAYAKGDLDQAEKYYRQAISVKADYAEAHNNLGLVLSAQKKYPEAEKHLQRAVSLNPRLANAHFNLGLLFVDMAIPTAAIEHFRRTIALDPDYVDAYLELANLLEKMGQIDEAEMNLRTALALNPQSAKAYGNLAKIFNNRGNLQDAQGLARKSIEIDPSFAFGHNVLGVILQGLDRIDEAMAEFQKAVSLDPELNTAKYNLAQPLMLHGDYDKGLALYESRFDAYREVGRSYHLVSESLLEIVSRIPCWQGESLEGRRLLVWEEQGFGDTLMMLRYLPLLLEKGLANITVRCSPVLVRLVRSMPIAEHLQVIEMLAVSTEHFDFHCSLMSLPHRFGTRPETIPTHLPYLTVPEVELAKWQNRLAGLSGLKVGLVWLGNPDNPLDAKRSITLAQLAPALATRGVSFISLQKGGTSSLNSMGNNSLHDWMDECADFLDTAALIENLDLVIAVDTAVAHLGGALGKPVWLLNRRNTDWRWFLDREDSPWYPTLRIFRQTRCGEWDDVIRRVALELGELASG